VARFGSKKEEKERPEPIVTRDFSAPRDPARDSALTRAVQQI
jgi:hypothetical protein